MDAEVTPDEPRRRPGLNYTEMEIMMRNIRKRKGH